MMAPSAGPLGKWRDGKAKLRPPGLWLVPLTVPLSGSFQAVKSAQPHTLLTSSSLIFSWCIFKESRLFFNIKLY